ncbi:MAG: polymer-forming cytoskeletal protein [bacterium]|nr:polymer-forming cytoskeletal protein [bacterium]
MIGKDSSGTDSKVNSIIGKGSNCNGDIAVNGGLKIDGQFKGTIKAQSLYVGRDATVRATITVNNAVIGGKVLGDVVATEFLELQAKAEIVGDVETKKLIVAENAVLDGLIRMGRTDDYNKRPKLKKEEKKTEPVVKEEKKSTDKGEKKIEKRKNK